MGGGVRRWICKNLEKAWKSLKRAPLTRIRQIRSKNIPMFSTRPSQALQIFTNLFLAVLGEINELRPKKFGFFEFCVSDHLTPPAPPRKESSTMDGASMFCSEAARFARRSIAPVAAKQFRFFTPLRTLPATTAPYVMASEAKQPRDRDFYGTRPPRSQRRAGTTHNSRHRHGVFTGGARGDVGRRRDGASGAALDARRSAHCRAYQSARSVGRTGG